MAKHAKHPSGASEGIKVVAVKSRLSEMALKPGGVSRDSAVDGAASAIDGLRGAYPEWLEKDVGKLQRLIEQAHEEGGESPDRLNEIYRQAAQIRDLGTNFDYPMITAAADSLCELMYRLIENKTYDTRSIDCHVTALRYLKDPATQNKNNNKTMPLLRGLKVLVERYERPSEPTSQSENEDAKTS